MASTTASLCEPTDDIVVWIPVAEMNEAVPSNHPAAYRVPFGPMQTEASEASPGPVRSILANGCPLVFNRTRKPSMPLLAGNPNA